MFGVLFSVLYDFGVSFVLNMMFALIFSIIHDRWVYVYCFLFSKTSLILCMIFRLIFSILCAILAYI